jgi:hypothetical protein
VIRLGLRLTLAGGREAVARLVLVAVAVAIGVALLLGALAGLNAVGKQNDRYAWLETGYSGSDAPRASHGSLLWRLRADYYQGKVIGRVDVAAVGPRAPVPPGIPQLPRPGQFYASPALAALLRSVPAAQLAERYPGHEVGIVGSGALPSPDSLIVVVGRRPADLAGQPDVRRVGAISTTAPGACNGSDCALGVGTHKRGLILILSVVAAAILFPILLLIGAATRLSAARREQRFAAMRLVGATPRQVAVLATVESVLAAVAGVAAGFGLLFAVRPALAKIPFTGERFFSADLSLTLLDVLIAAVGIPVAAGVAARVALRRVTISPLGVTRRVTPRAPSAWRVVPLAAGAAELAYFAYVKNIGAASHTSPTTEAVVFLAGVLLMMAGLVVAGPWLTMLAARLVARRAERPATLIAARRLADDPKAGFRAISGLVLAVFIGTCATAIITAIAAGNGGGTVDSRLAGVLVDVVGGPDTAPGVPAVSAATRSTLRSIAGVDGVAVIYDRPIAGPLGGAVEEVVSCADLADVPALGKCQPGAATAIITPNYGGDVLRRTQLPDTVWTAADLTVARLKALRVDTVVVGTNGSAAAIERTRTALDRTYPTTFAAETVDELHADNVRLLDDYRRLAEVVILTSLPIAGWSLAVSVAGGIAERRRPFSLLRLSGTPLRTLRRVIGLEAAAPMLITAAASAGVGLLAAQLFLRAQLDESLRALGLAYYLILVTGLVAAMGVIASTLPLLNRMTGPEIARND